MNLKIAKPFLLIILTFPALSWASTKPEINRIPLKGAEITTKQIAVKANSATTNVSLAVIVQTTPDAVVRALYKVHTPDKSILDTKTRVPLDKFFDKNLADLIWTDLTTHTDEVGVIDFDPFYNGQDFDIKNLVVGQAKVNGTKATVKVSFTNFNQRNLLTYSLVRQNGGWKISDVRYDAKNSLLGYFKEAAKEQASNASDVKNNFEGNYQVGETSCTVKPIKMAFEVRWAKGEGSEIFIFQDRANDKYIFASDPPKGKANVFAFDDESYKTGTFYRADGKEFPIKKIK